MWQQKNGKRFIFNGDEIGNFVKAKARAGRSVFKEEECAALNLALRGLDDNSIVLSKGTRIRWWIERRKKKI